MSDLGRKLLHKYYHFIHTEGIPINSTSHHTPTLGLGVNAWWVFKIRCDFIAPWSGIKKLSCAHSIPLHVRSKWQNLRVYAIEVQMQLEEQTRRLAVATFGG